MSTMITPNAVVAFGEFLKEQRKKIGLTSRKIALGAGMQPSNYCRMENGTLKPPQDAERLKTLYKSLKLEADAEKSARFYDLAAEANNATPLDLAEIISRDEAIPLMLRTIGNRRLSQDEIEGIIALIHGRHEKPLQKKNQDRTRKISQ
jgi:transcriptional regulator with XRE-family HTH domain